MKRILPSLLGISLAIATAMTVTPVFAIPVVRQVSQSQAQGLVGTGVTVTVWIGSGTNIDFSRTDEVVQRAWIDDPHAIAVDFDAPLTRRGEASVVHLKRVTGIHFPNLPEARSTLLTVVTRSPYGKKTYLFEVRYGAGAPQYATLAVVPNAQLTSGLLTGNQNTRKSDVERGLEQAIVQQLLPQNSPVVSRVRSFLTLVENGMPMSRAAVTAKVSMTVISKLAELGTAPTATTPAALN